MRLLYVIFMSVREFELRSDLLIHLSSSRVKIEKTSSFGTPSVIDALL